MFYEQFSYHQWPNIEKSKALPTKLKGTHSFWPKLQMNVILFLLIFVHNKIITKPLQEAIIHLGEIGAGSLCCASESL